ncbi:hypothetical protein Ate01nite_08880 [Actinoplanes teichomyceticus]|nr:hypothetical protein Ate01nite_08880 [Actinoplanes teichomyceticus]
MLGLTLLEQLQLLRVGLHDQLRLGAALLDVPVLSEVHTAAETRHEQTDRCGANSEPAPEPIHEDSLRRGQ